MPPSAMAGLARNDGWKLAVAEFEFVRKSAVAKEKLVQRLGEATQPRTDADTQQLYRELAEISLDQTAVDEVFAEIQKLTVEKMTELDSLQPKHGLSQQVTALRKLVRNYYRRSNLYATAEERQIEITDSQPDDDSGKPVHLSLPHDPEEAREMLSFLADLSPSEKEAGVFTVVQVYQCLASTFSEAREATRQNDLLVARLKSLQGSYEQLESLEIRTAKSLEEIQDAQHQALLLKKQDMAKLAEMEEKFDEQVQEEAAKLCDVRVAELEKRMVSQERFTKLQDRLENKDRQLEDAENRITELRNVKREEQAAYSNEYDIYELTTIHQRSRDEATAEAEKKLASVKDELVQSNSHAADLEEKLFAQIQECDLRCDGLQQSIRLGIVRHDGIRDELKRLHKTNNENEIELITLRRLVDSRGLTSVIDHLALRDGSTSHSCGPRDKRILSLATAFNQFDDMEPKDVVTLAPHTLAWDICMADPEDSDSKSFRTEVNHLWVQTSRLNIDWDAINLVIERLLLFPATANSIGPEDGLSLMAAQASTNLTESLVETNGDALACIVTVRALAFELKYVLRLDRLRMQRLIHQIRQHVFSLGFKNELVTALAEWMHLALDGTNAPNPTPTTRLLRIELKHPTRLAESFVSGKPRRMVRSGRFLVVLHPDSKMIRVYLNTETTLTEGLRPSIIFKSARRSEQLTILPTPKFSFRFEVDNDLWVEALESEQAMTLVREKAAASATRHV